MTHECRFQGECSGICPRCESELRYLEKQLAARAAAGKRVAIAALCAGMTFSAAGCSSPINSIVSDLNSVYDLAGFLTDIEDEDAGGSTGGGRTTGGGRVTGGGRPIGGESETTGGGRSTGTGTGDEIIETTGEGKDPTGSSLIVMLFLMICFNSNRYPRAPVQ